MPTTDELITRALHDRAATVTTTAPQYPDFGADRIETRRPASPWRLTRRPRVLQAVAATVVAVLAITIGVYAVQPSRRHQGAAPGSNSTVLVDTTWRLTGVRSETTAYPVPADYRAELRFSQHGRVSGLDGFNAIAGTYRTAGHRITIGITATGTVGGTGTFPAREAMSSIYVPTSLAADSVTSTYTLTTRTLVLDTSHWRLTFTAETPSTSVLSTPPSSTASQTK